MGPTHSLLRLRINGNFFHHRGTEDTEDVVLFTHRETTMGKITCTFGDSSILTRTKIFLILQH